MDRYAVIGNPVTHSKSPFIHTAFANQTGQNLTYETLFAPLDGFAKAVSSFAASGGRGLNVTVPFKLEACALADRLSKRAQAAGAVNTLCFRPDGIFGDNTDGTGLVRDLSVNLAFALKGSHILLLGAGGAARGVLQPLLQEQPTEITIANRSPAKATQLADKFSTSDILVRGCGFNELAGNAFDLVINATSASLANEVPPLPPGIYAEAALAYDMMYGSTPTPFIQSAIRTGVARTADGLGMLVEQAAESFWLWRQVRPATREILQQLRMETGK